MRGVRRVRVFATAPPHATPRIFAEVERSTLMRRARRNPSCRARLARQIVAYGFFLARVAADLPFTTSPFVYFASNVPVITSPL